MADLAYISPERLEDVDPDSHFRGAPDLVIKVLSASDNESDIYDLESVCLSNGAREFWIVDPDSLYVKVSTPDGGTVTYESGQEIPLPLFDHSGIAVADVFAARVFG